MPVLSRRQPSLDLRKAASARDSMESNHGSKDRLWWVNDDFEKPTKEADFPSNKPSSLASQQKSMNNLRLKTEPELHDHYQSSEESASPSPDEYQSDSNDGSVLGNEDQVEKEDDNEDGLRKTTLNDSSTNDCDPFDSYATIFFTGLATSIQVIHIGRPKMIKITNSAPAALTHKRIPRPTSTRLAAHKRLTSLDENMPYPGPSSSISAQSYTTAPSMSVIPIRNQSLPRVPSNQQPDTWLPESIPSPTLSDSDHYFPEHHSPERTSYEDYDPYHLDPPRLQRNSSSSRSSTLSLSHFYQGNQQSTSQASLAAPQTTKGKGAERWRGIARGLGRSKANKPQAESRADVKTAKPVNRMLARGAAEREESLVLPPFPFEGVVVL